jgi:phage terminase large subunit
VRKTTPALRESCYKLFTEILASLELDYSINRTEMRFENDIGSEIVLKGLDDPEKIKSAEFNYIWCEEATELTIDDYRQLNLRLRRKTNSINQIFLSCNPISSLHWIKTEIEDKPNDEVIFNYSTYKDNPFLDDVYRKQLEELINQDINYYNIYALGKWGILKDLIYSFKVVDKPDHWDDIIYGVDFGFNAPSAVVKAYIVDDKAIWREVFYQSGLTNSQLIAKLNDIIPLHHRTRQFYADSAEPARIQEFYDAGYNIKPADKSVIDGIDYCKTKVIGITKDSPNLIKEKQSYKYKEDKNGNVLEEPVKFNDHLLDAGRYATYTYFKQGKPNIYIMGED